MAYVHRVVKAGPCVEHKKMQSFRVHTKGVKRGPNTGHTTEKQERINERVAEEHLRWDINANFGHRDLHAVLHYYVKDSSFEEILENKAAFLRNLRKLCKKRGITFKAVVVIETKRMTNPHIHVIISRMDPEIITEAWENVPRGGGGISFKPKGIIIAACFVAFYVAGRLNPDIVAIDIDGETVNVATAANLAMVTAYVLYAKDVFSKLSKLVLSKTSGTPEQTGGTMPPALEEPADAAEATAAE